MIMYQLEEKISEISHNIGIYIGTMEIGHFFLLLIGIVALIFFFNYCSDSSNECNNNEKDIFKSTFPFEDN